MKDYQYIKNPKDLIGKCFEIRDSGFGDTYAKITYAFFAAPDNKELVIRCNPDTLAMEYSLMPNNEGKYNLERVKNVKSR
jgi:hypothetical protein